METQKNPKEDKDKQDLAQLKKLLDAHIIVAHNKLGKPPTLEDIQHMLMEKADNTNSVGAPTPIASLPTDAKNIDDKGLTHQDVKGEPTAKSGDVMPEILADSELKDQPKKSPKILDMRVYFGQSGEGDMKKPDPHKILFYGTKDEKYYDCANQCWADKKPSIIEHLNSRPINFNEKDIVAAIANGVMDDDDYEALEKAKMIDETPKKLWELTKKLHILNEDLSKSDAIDDESLGDTDDSAETENSNDTDVDGDGENVLKSYMDTAGVEPRQQDPGEDLIGENILEQIMEAAISAVSDNMEEKIRSIVLHELSKFGLGQPDGDSDEVGYGDSNDLENGSGDDEADAQDMEFPE